MYSYQQTWSGIHSFNHFFFKVYACLYITLHYTSYYYSWTDRIHNRMWIYIHLHNSDIKIYTFVYILRQKTYTWVIIDPMNRLHCMMEYYNVRVYNLPIYVFFFVIHNKFQQIAGWTSNFVFFCVYIYRQWYKVFAIGSDLRINYLFIHCKYVRLFSALSSDCCPYFLSQF